MAPRRLAEWTLGLLLLVLCSGRVGADEGLPQAPAGESIIVALAEHPQARIAVGGTPRAGYAAAYGAGQASLGTQALADALAAEYQLQAQGAWTIAPLKLHCLLFRLAPAADAAELLARLARDPRVQLAQPLNEFETLGESAAPVAAIAQGAVQMPLQVPMQAPLQVPVQSPQSEAYNDPYVGLQRGFAAMGVAQAQRWSRGEGVRVALIDTGVDAAHPDLLGRIASQRDFVDPAAHPAPANGQAERHGTQMAGVIAADANNGLGIVGVAPQVQLLTYRACWELAAAGGAARCNSFTLAQALGAAIAAGVDVINLSLGGPPDPLLRRLAEHAISRGIVIVGAVPPGGSQSGFPVDVPGVLAVYSSDEAGVLAVAGPGGFIAAPGRDILTLAPGGSYDFASGSSLAAAQITGAVALLRSLSPRLSAQQARDWLSAGTGQPVSSSCEAIRQLRSQARCTPASLVKVTAASH